MRVVALNLRGFGMSCKARKDSSGDIYCKRCDLSWSSDDNEPPECLTTEQIGLQTCKRIAKELEEDET